MDNAPPYAGLNQVMENHVFALTSVNYGWKPSYESKDISVGDDVI